jgi:transaldolase
LALRLLIDSADPQSWSELWPLGMFAGITTNPTLLQRAGLPCTLSLLEELSCAASALGCVELQLQAWGASPDDLLACAKALLALAPERIVVKLPLTQAGLLAAQPLVAAGERVTLTACFGIPQVLAAAALGCTYVAPYLGRISRNGRDGCAEVMAMQQCLSGVGSTTRLLVASLRSTQEISRLAAAGIDTFTLAPSLARELWIDADTEAAVAQFEAEARGPLPEGGA